MAFHAAKLVELRGRLGISQEACASRSGVPLGTYADLERGKTKDPSLDTVRKLAVFFGVNVEEFINGGHVPQPVGRPVKPDLLPTYHYLLLGTVGASNFDKPDVYDPPKDYETHVKYPRGCFALIVTGTSCQSAGIPDGATVVIRPTSEPQERRFMVVQSEEGYALKLCSGGKLWQFRPGDPEPSAITLDASTRIVGYVVGGSFGEPDLDVDDLKPKPKKKGK